MQKLEPTPLTVPLSWIYGGLAAFYHAAFDTRIRKPVDLGVPVLSVGNLVGGGTGKTPVVRALAQTVVERGLVPAILTRGYGGWRTGLLQNGHWENGDHAGPDAGDEPLDLSLGAPTVMVGVGKDRAKMARRILERQHVDVFLLDDGYQHRQLEREANVLLLSAERPFGNGHLLPAGPLRESPAAIRRATALLITGGEGSDPAPTRERLRKFNIPTWTAQVCPTHFLTSSGETIQRLDRPAIAVAGIAEPERFYRSLRYRGVQMVSEQTFPDHHDYTVDDVRRLEQMAADQNAALVTTSKDIIRLVSLARADWYTALMRLEVEGGWGTFLEHNLPGLQKKGAAPWPLPSS